MSQVSLNTRISPEADKMLREWAKISGKSYANIVDEAIVLYVLTVNKDICMKHLPKDMDEYKESPEDVWRKKMQDAVTRIELPWLAEMEKERESNDQE